MFESFNDFLNNEARDFNDPLLIKMRAAQMKAQQKKGASSSAKKELSPAKAKKLAKLEDERAQIMRDMEQEAEMEGGEAADRYGDMLNKLDKQIAKLTESEVTEAKSISKIQKEWGNVTAIMKDTVAKYKTAEGQEKEDLLDELKSLTAAKKKLEAELDGAVGLKDIDADLVESYEGNMKDFKYEFPIKFEDVTGNPVKAIKKISKKGKGFEVRTATYMSEPEMQEVADEMGLELISYENGGNVAITVYESAVNEGKVQLKRKYTENHPAITAGKFAKVRNKMLEAIGDGKITQEEFDGILKELSSSSKRWMGMNTKYFSVSEDGISLSTFGKRALRQITINENMDKFIFESFGDFVDNTNTLCEATVEMDAMDPDNKDFLKFLKKNRVKIISKDMQGPGAGNPVITMQGKRKDLENVLADGEFGWDDADLAEYIEESVSITEAFKSSKLRNLMNMNAAGTSYGQKIHNLTQAFYGLTKAKLDEIGDENLIDYPNAEKAAKEFKKDNNVVVFYIVDNPKENPYADDKSMNDMVRPGILGISKAGEFLSVSYQGSEDEYKNRKINFAMKSTDDKTDAIGGNKKYRGYGATGLYNVKRVADLADRAVVINLEAIKNTDLDARGKAQSRAKAQAGAIAFKSDKDFKKANMARYKEILATKASKLPLDKMVQDAIQELSNQIKDGLAKGEKGRYGDIIIGRNKKDKEVRLRDASNHMSNILDEYNRYVDYVVQAEAEKESGYSTGYYEKQYKEYAKNINDRVKKIKSFDYAW